MDLKGDLMGSHLLGDYEQRISALRNRPKKSTTSFSPKTPDYFAEKTTFVENADSAESLWQLARQLHLSHIGVDTEFSYDADPVPLGRGREWHDPRSVRPLLLSLTLAETYSPRLCSFVVDLRGEFPRAALERLLQLDVVFVGHQLQAEHLCLFQLGLPTPRRLWDTFLVERALHLGLNNKKQAAARSDDAAEQIEAANAAEDAKNSSCSLTETCRRYGVVHPFAASKESLQQSFLNHASTAEFSIQQIEYAAADAEAAARLYLPQVLRAAQEGILQHLLDIEMPWSAIAAELTWRGLPVDERKQREIREGIAPNLEKLSSRLREYGIDNFRSRPQIQAAFGKLGVLHLFRKAGGDYSFKREDLSEFRNRHEAIRLVHMARKLADAAANPLVTGELVGGDGRVHPEYFTLGADTGRVTSSKPNVIGLGRVLRPLVVPAPGCGVGSVDLSQIEVGIAAAVYQDERLMEMFNQSDVYVALAKEIFADQLTEEEQGLSDGEFKRRRGELRDQVKILRLGITYGMKPYGLALRLGIPEPTAAALHQRLFSRFPTLKRALAETPELAAMQGSVAAIGGLRRRRAYAGSLGGRERNWMVNHPVQASAAVVFKAAGVRLSHLYPRLGARLLIPLYDEYVFEAPSERLGEAAELTRCVMCDAVREYFPKLEPKAEINFSSPQCWNKDGDAVSIERWLGNPFYGG